jgi:predicted phage terminase large subunit-like protein
MARHLEMLNRKLVDVAEGRSRRLIVTMPPRHGKSSIISQYFPAWYLGRYPDRRVILTSYEADFAAGWGRKVRDVLAECGAEYFGVRVRSDSSAANRWDLEGHAGGMVTAGVGGPITGRGADIFLCDDPIKNAEEAASEAIRERNKDWWRSTAYTRLEPGGSVVVVSTRWHADDLAGWLIAGGDDNDDGGASAWDVLNLPALAEDDDPLGRAPGEALWPERYDRAALDEIRRSANVGEYFFAAMFQGSPVPRTGGMFSAAWPIVKAIPVGCTFVRYWDKAGTAGGGAFTAGVKMARAIDRSYYITHVERGQWSAGEREAAIKATAAMDGPGVAIWVEQEPGSGGLESADNTVINLAGYAVHKDRVSGDKATRAGPLAAQVEVGNVRLVEGPWNRAFVDEAKLFPHGKYKDQVDAAAGAFNKLALAPAPAVLRPAANPLSGYRG